MAATTLSTVDYMFMRKYSDKNVANQARRDHPTFDMIPIEGGFNGEAHYYFITYANPQGVASVFATAQSSASSSKGVQLRAVRKKKYGIITLDGEAMLASEGNDGAIYDVVSRETDGIIMEVGDTIAFDLFRDGNGVRGRRASASTNVITLAVADDVRNFKPGMTVIADDTVTGASPRTGSTTVTSIDEDTGTITLTSAAAISGFADNDYLFRSGDQNGGCIEGLEVLNPLTAPTAGDSFRGIDRSVDVRGLAGSRLTGTGSIEEDLNRVAVSVSQRGKKLTHAVLNPVNFFNVQRRFQAKVEYQGAGGTADWGFEFIMLNTPAGALKLYSDPDCPMNRGRVFNNKAHYIKTLGGDLPHVIRDDGQRAQREASEDAIQIRLRGLCNYFQQDPAAFGVTSI